eukprot:3459262-Rhodomonas_salina.1
MATSPSARGALALNDDGTWAETGACARFCRVLMQLYSSSEVLLEFSGTGGLYLTPFLFISKISFPGYAVSACGGRVGRGCGISVEACRALNGVFDVFLAGDRPRLHDSVRCILLLHGIEPSEYVGRSEMHRNWLGSPF